MERKLIWNVTYGLDRKGRLFNSNFDAAVANVMGYEVNVDGNRMALITVGNQRFWAFMKNLRLV